MELVTLVVGFFLTTVAGGFLGTWFQRRTWDHQQRMQLVEDELARASGVCQTVTRLMDKRLYRMLRLFYLLRSSQDQEVDSSLLEAKLADYDAILYEWNEQLNLNLALVGTYFGEQGRDWLHGRVYEEFRLAGASLEAMYRDHGSGRHSIDTRALETSLLNLNDAIYRMGLFMMAQLRAGAVGRAAPLALPHIDSPESAVGVPPRLAGIESSQFAPMQSGDKL